MLDSREGENCRKRPRLARKCAKAHSFLICKVNHEASFNLGNNILLILSIRSCVTNASIMGQFSRQKSKIFIMN